MKKIILPSELVSIGDYAFTSCGDLTDVSIPSSVISIGVSAFSGCKNLEKAVISEGVEAIGDYAFYNCAKLSDLTIPQSVESIGNYTFSGTQWLKDQQNRNTLVIVNDMLIDGTTAKGEVIVPNTVKSVGGYAFYGCGKITSVTIPDSVTVIGYSAFSSCENLKKIIITENVAIIDEFAFWNCKNLAVVNYTASKDKWDTIEVKRYNNELLNADIHFDYFLHTHSYAENIITQPNCTQRGERELTCTICGDTYTETIPAKGHTKSDWIIDKAAKPGVKGSKHKECTVCGKILETAEIPALPIAKQSISKASVSLSTSTYAYDGKVKKPSVTVKLGGKTLKNGTDYTVSYSNNIKIGTATVKITGKGNYTGTITKTFKIKNDFRKSTVSGIANKTYTGKAQTQKITVKFGGKTLKNGTDYTVSYSNNTKVGTATVKIVGKGNYTGTITKTFKINPAKQSISKISAKSKGFTVSWSKKDHATGYEVQYGTDSKFKGALKVTATNKNTTSKTVSKLKGSKKYYVRVRIYTTVNGTRYHGAWSAAKTVTTKK